MHARLKNEFTEDEKCHNLMSWPILSSIVMIALGERELTLCWLCARVSTFCGFTFTTLLLGVRGGPL